MQPPPPPRSPSKRRAAFALVVAAVADLVPVVLGPLALGFVDEAVDLVAMVLTSLLLGFHPLLLPTFVAEFIPGIELLPTWSACVAAVIWMRRGPNR